jgi:2-keto-4-pentenoate hydratase/2-oxohepta-3-ene-1,7-dioic acid hydratase in catechol pathway
VRREGLVDLNQADPSVPHCIKLLLGQGDAGRTKAEAAMEKGSPFPASQAEVLPPIPSPGKILCVGVNYADHAAETGLEPPEAPIVFCKLDTALSATERPICLPTVSPRVDYEAELVVVIGKQGRNIQKEEAMDYVAGYTCGNDVSARDWQKETPGGQWLLGKSFDSFAPVGPHLVTVDEVPAPVHLGIRLQLNGQVMQESNTSQFLFDIPSLIAYISQVATLEIGDLIFTGTPPGVGDARNPPIYLRPGDTVEVVIDKVGRLRNPVV